MGREIIVHRMKPWIAKTLIGLLLIVAVIITILCWTTNNILLVAGLGIVFVLDCIVLDLYGVIKLFEVAEEEN